MNLVYHLETTAENLIVHTPGDGTDNDIDRAVELHNALRSGVFREQ